MLDELRKTSQQASYYAPSAESREVICFPAIGWALQATQNFMHNFDSLAAGDTEHVRPVSPSMNLH
jgi:hypothetical protein